MQLSENVSYNLLEQVPSNNRVINPLGLQYHLSLQGQLLPGITSATNRARYYTLQAWYYQHAYDEKLVTTKDFERIFILACLAHHNGDSSHPALTGVYNKTRFDGKWDEIDTFDLDFEIGGDGRSDYIAQLKEFRCVWQGNFDQIHRTQINERLADTLELPHEVFEKDEFTKSELREELSELCICTYTNAEIDVLSKLFFGFFSKTDNGWQIDEEEFERFQNGGIDLAFEPNIQTTIESKEGETRQKNLRRRNTLFLVLKIISATQPEDVRKSIWDAVYFAQSRRDQSSIEFGALQPIREFWECFQLNLYYLYALDMFLDILQRLIRDNHGIQTAELMSLMEDPQIATHLNNTLDRDCLTVEDIRTAVADINGGEQTALDAPINESSLFDQIKNADVWQETAAMSLLLLLTLSFKYEQISKGVRNQAYDTKDKLVVDPLAIESFMQTVSDQSEEPYTEFLKELLRKIKRKHLFEASRSLRNGTRAWLFTEEDSRLYFARRSPIPVSPRDNRWRNIESLLADLGFITEQDDRTVLTERGESWLQRIE